MKKQLIVILACVCMSWESFAQEQGKPAAAPAEVIPDQATLEKRFTDTLTQATFNGRWCLVEQGKLGPSKEETYTIQGVNKVGGDVWLVHARIQYGQRDVTVPVPVRVKWAGDTPVISITDLAIPGVGTYTARVLIYGDTYAGTWSGGTHGGLLNGAITRKEKTKE